jgi:hypothetical protein
MNDIKNIEALNGLFGSYKAEWLRTKIFDLFTEPSYLPELMDNRPCVLQGGRGTGKTTVLRGLSYQGQFALHKNDLLKFDEINFIGLYIRVDTNQVRAFHGGSIDSDWWIKIFSHYFSLIICKDILTFLNWHNEKNPSDEKLNEQKCTMIAKSLNIQQKVFNQLDLFDLINSKLIEFQSLINSPSKEIFSILSMSGVPIITISEQVLNLKQFKNKIFFILLDEYENYENYQQQVINTLIKHTTEYYTFKIGVRELGWRIKYTLNPDELLNDPADYVFIKIEDEFQDQYFSDFAKNVCQQRIRELFAQDMDSTNYSIEKALDNVTIEGEAILLGIDKTNYYNTLSKIPTQDFNKIKHLSHLYQYLIAYWAKWHNMTLPEAINDYIEDQNKWNQRYENYKYEMLFKIHKGRGKAGIQKYYAGWNTFIKLSHGNIRYLMELFYRSYEKHLKDGEPLLNPVSIKNQTLAAQEAGLKNLMELEGLTKNGAQIIKLLLGFGRVFNVLSSEEGRFSPEKNQFSIINQEGLTKECKELLTSAVMHLALIRFPGNKLTDTSHTREYMYTLHPIYAAYFSISFRRKRKLEVTEDDIFGLINTPKVKIKSILDRSNIQLDTENTKPLPSQLSIFENFYND